MIRTAMVALLLAGFVCGQTFEVASVKRNTTGERPSGDVKGDRFLMYNMPMKVLVARAYQVSFDRVVGPSWLDTEGYDIIAKFAPNTTGEQLWTMLQNLLAERFQMVVHREQKPVPVYALVAAKGGIKLHEAPEESAVKPGCKREGLLLTCTLARATMADLAEAMPHWMSMNWFHFPLLDQTGLTAAYDITLTFAMTNNMEDPVDPPALSLMDALKEQVGVRIEERKAPLERIVIDRIERIPTEN